MKKTIDYLMFLLMALGVLSGCTHNEVPKQAEQVYTSYLETDKTDSYLAVKDYCHYEMKNREEMAAKSTDHIVDYRILEWCKLSDELWAVTAEISTTYQPQMRTVTNFVGIIDGEYRVMTGYRQIPQELKEGIDMSAYIPEDEILEEDLLD